MADLRRVAVKGHISVSLNVSAISHEGVRLVGFQGEYVDWDPPLVSEILHMVGCQTDPATFAVQLQVPPLVGRPVVLPPVPHVLLDVPLGLGPADSVALVRGDEHHGHVNPHSTMHPIVRGFREYTPSGCEYQNDG